MTGSYQDVADEARQRVAHLEGEIAALRDQLAAALATEDQLRHELEVSRSEAAVAQAELAHVQHQGELRAHQAEREVTDLREQLDDAIRRAHDADEQRATVIAALGRRGRRGLARTPVSSPPPHDGHGAHDGHGDHVGHDSHGHSTQDPEEY
jgi:chromosome segregation ATPase